MRHVVYAVICLGVAHLADQLNLHEPMTGRLCCVFGYMDVDQKVILSLRIDIVWCVLHNVMLFLVVEARRKCLI